MVRRSRWERPYPAWRCCLPGSITTLLLCWSRSTPSGRGSPLSVARPMVRCHRTSSLRKIRSLWSCFRAMTFTRYPVWPGRSRPMWRGLFAAPPTVRSTAWPGGREGRVTEVDGHVVRGIDGRPAIEFYREFLGNADITQLTEYPLAVTADDDRGANSYYLRAPGRTDEATGCIHFLGDVPDGARVHITTTNRDQILDATRSSFQHALDDFPNASGGGGKPALALCISCAGRKQILGSRTQEEGRIVNELLAGVPAAGFYGYGEIARLAKDGISHYHNETFTTLLLGGRVGSA